MRGLHWKTGLSHTPNRLSVASILSRLIPVPNLARIWQLPLLRTSPYATGKKGQSGTLTQTLEERPCMTVNTSPE